MLWVPYFKVKTVNYIFMKWVGTYKKKTFLMSVNMIMK